MTVVHSAPALHTTHRSTQECLEAYARTEENPVLLGQALDEYTNIYLQQLEPHLAQQLAQALAAGCTLDKCAAECRSLSEHRRIRHRNARRRRFCRSAGSHSQVRRDSRHARRYGQERPCNGRFWADLWAFLNPVLPVKTARVAQTRRKERL